MAEKITSYQARLADIAERAAAMKSTLLEPFRMDNGKFLPCTTTAEYSQREHILESAVSHSIYSLSKNGKMIAAINANALQQYEQLYNHLPSDELLASAHKAIENAFLFTERKSNTPLGGIYEAANMSDSEGILMHDRLISLVLPVYLQSITGNMVTFIPGEFNQSKFFRIKRVAGSTFGDKTKSDIIDYDYDGVYSVMDQRHERGTANGTTTSFNYSSTVGTTVYPFKPKRVRVWVNHEMVAEDNGSGALAGSYTVGTNPVVVSGTVNYTNGTATVTFSTAPAAGMELHIGYDVNIENNAHLILRVDHQMFSKVLYPHESAITGDATIQAVWALRRELGQDLDNMNLQGLRNLIAADKDKKHLRDMLFHAVHSVEWNRTPNEHLTLRENYETLNEVFLAVDSLLMNANGVSGLVGLVAGTQATNIFRYLPQPMFTAAPGYRSTAQPHIVGRVFGQWDLYCNPQMDGWTALCFAKGPNHGETAYVVGDAVPALTFRHPVLGDLVQRATMWELSYRDMQPFDGKDYLCKLHLPAFWLGE